MSIAYRTQIHSSLPARGKFVAALLAGLLATVAATAQQAPSGPERDQWRKSLSRVKAPGKGCFTAAYPNTQWREVACVAPPPYAELPSREAVAARGARAISAKSPSGLIVSATGSFDSLVGVTSESGPIDNQGPPVKNAYSLQLNTDFFQSPACKGSPNSGCLAWEQFIFDNDGANGYAHMQYWLTQYNTSCPSGWNTKIFQGSTAIYCWKNSQGAVGVPFELATKLDDLTVTGNVDASSDSITVTRGLNAYSATGDNAVAAAQGWRAAEFNVFGLGGGGQASFNEGATIVARTELFDGSSAPPICVSSGFTAETNNLSFGPAAPSASGEGPALLALKSSNGGAASSCAAATEVGYVAPPRLVIADEAVETDFSGRSNGHHYNRDTPPDPLIAITTLGGRETGDDPCDLGIFYKEFPAAVNDAKEGDFLGCSSKDGHGNGNIFAPTMPKGYFVTGLAVVLNSDRNKVKGFWLKGAPAACIAGLDSATVPDATNGDHQLTVACNGDLATQQDANERTNAVGNKTNHYDSDWEKQVFCPKGSVATGVALNIEEGFGAKQVYSGLALRCRAVAAITN